MQRSRLVRAQAHAHSAGLDALLVTHPPNIRYLSGLEASTGIMVLSAAAFVLVVDFRYATVARETVAGLGVEVEVTSGSLDEAAAAVLQRLGAKRIGIEAEYLSVGRYGRLKDLLTRATSDDVTLVTTERLIGRMRAIKDEAEIQTLREAARRISTVARDVRQFVAPGMSEMEVATAIDVAMRRAGFERPAFETIVASGPNAALPHARPGSRRLAAGEGVVLDFGGVYDGYCVDLTRTLQLGEVTARVRRMFDAVREAHAAAIAAVAPGVAPADIDGAARRVLEAHGLGMAFGHGTGHGIGLEVHEEPRISKSAPAGEIVAAGMVFTIEPGAYVPGIGGVRIEDDVLVVDGGCERLTDVPLEL